MPISMSSNARYVTQQSIYDCPLLGPLTNRRIAKYQKAGRYGEEYKQQQKQRTKGKSRKGALNALVKSLGL